MNYLRNISFIIAITPIIFTFYVSTLNINKTSKIRLLVWETAPQSVALLLVLGSSLGFSISSLNIILSTKSTAQNQRKVIRTIDSKQKEFEEDPLYSELNSKSSTKFPQESYVERDIREPSPTISVPYRIIKQPLDSSFIDEYTSRKVSSVDSSISSPREIDSTVDSQDSIQSDWAVETNEDW